LNNDIKESFCKNIELLKSLNANIIDINLEYIKYSLSTYYIISTAEATSNLARFDGIRYGYRSENYNNLDEIYIKSRSEGFGNEVKKRIMLGTYVLSSGYYDAYYKKANMVRNLIKNEFNEIFKSVDIIAMPTAPSIAFKIGEKTSNPIDMYLQDIFTVPVNVAKLPAISVPGGFVNNMPVGLQFIADYLREDKLINISYTYEKNTNYYSIKPNF
ncbi:MAG: amidase family protein, partial [Clostridia bacterium]